MIALAACDDRIYYYPYAIMVGAMQSLVQFIPLFLLGALFCVIPYKLAPRVGANRVTWLIVSLIPIVNFFFLYYVFYRVLAHMLDKLNEIAAGRAT